MRTREARHETPFGRSLLIVVGVLGALAAFDAILLFFLMLVTSTSAYVGVVLFIAVPIVVIVGIAIAATAFWLVTRAAQEPEAHGHHAPV